MSTVTKETRRSGIVPPPVWPGDGGDDDHDQPRTSFPLSKGQLGLWILLAVIVMLFAGLSSAYIVLRGAPDWQNIQIPSILWLNTAVLLASSATMAAARRSFR